MYCPGIFWKVAACVAIGALAACGGDHDPLETGADAGSGDAPGAPAALCQPAPYWLAEGETVEIDILCATEGDDITGADVTLAGLPGGATYDAQAARVTWTPALDQAAVYEIAAELPERGESATITVGVAERWDHPDNVPIVDRNAYPMEYGVPVFFLSPPPEDNEEYASTTVVYGGITHQVEGKKRGRSSLAYPKNSYTLKFPRGWLFSDPEQAGGFMYKRKVVLTSTFDDNAYVRQRLAFELWNRLDPAHIQIQSFMAVVYLEDEFRGLYTVTDHVDDDLIAQQGLGGDGHLFKTVSHDANFRLTRFRDGPPKESLSEGFEKKSGDPEEGPGAFAELEELVRFAAETDDATFAAEVGARIDMDDYLDWLILITFIGGDDNAGKNTYHYRPLDGPWRMTPWDFNATFGQDWTTRRRPVADLNHYGSYNRLFERFLAIPSLSEQLATRYRQALDSTFSVADIDALVDDILAGLGPVVARDLARWGAEYESFDRWRDRTDFTTHEEEVSYVRSWIAERWALLDALY